MLLWLVVVGVGVVWGCAAPVRGQEMGDLQHFLTFALGNQLNTVMSSCCVIRQLQCPVRQPGKMTSHGNVTNDIVRSLESFSHCICHTHRRCRLLFPSSFLPDHADLLTYDVTFVTVTTTARYTCTYRSARALVCQYRQGLRTGLVGWLMPGMGSYGPLEVLGRGGFLGEEMEEAMEAMVETGIHPAALRGRNWQRCRRCIPLRCALRVVQEVQRVRRFLHRALSAGRQRQRYHWCLRQNNVRPPHSPSPPSPTTTTTTTTTSTPTTTTTTITTTVKPRFPFPLTPPPALLPYPFPVRPVTPTPPAPLITGVRPPTTTTSTTPPSHFTTPIPPTSTTHPSTTTTAATTTTITTTSIATTTKPCTIKPSSTPSVLSTPSPPPLKTPEGITTSPTTLTTLTTITAMSTVAPPVHSTPREVSSGGSSPPAWEVTSSSAVTSTRVKVTTTTPMVITRILVGSPAASPALPPSNKGVAVGTELGGGQILGGGGGGVAGVVIGMVTVIAAVITCLVILHRRRRHRHRHNFRDEVEGAGLSTKCRKKSRNSHKGKHQKARNLPSVSSKQAVIDGEEEDSISDKMGEEEENDDCSSVGDSEVTEERYVPPPTSLPTSKPQRHLREDDDRGVYASLDESAMSLSMPAFQEEGASLSASAAVGTDVVHRARSDLKLCSNTGSVRADVSSQSVRDSGHKGQAVMTLPGPTTTTITTTLTENGARKSPPFPERQNVIVAGSVHEDSALSPSSRGPGMYYNLRPGLSRDALVCPYTSGMGSYVNVVPTSANPYEKPGQVTQHLYTPFKGLSASRAISTINNKPCYLEPYATACLSPHSVTSRTGSSKKRDKGSSNSSSPGTEHAKMVRTWSSPDSSVGRQDKDMRHGTTVRRVSVGSNSTKEDLVGSPTRGSDHRTLSNSRTALSYPDAQSTVRVSAVEPRVDAEGYLLAVTPPPQPPPRL